MKKLLLSAAFVGVLANCALAADLPAYAPVAPVEAIPEAIWSGFYVGGNLGYGWTDFEFEDPRVNFDDAFLFGIPLEREFDDEGILGGVQLGANAQFGSIVVGVEGDFNWIGAEGEFRSSVDLLDSDDLSLWTEEGVSAELKWLSTFRGRLGYAFDRVLVYGTGGVAFGEVEAAGDVGLFGQTDTVQGAIGASLLLGEPVAVGEAYELLSFSASDSGDIHVGWTAGGGVEVKVTDRISARLEYLYADLGDMKHSGDGEISSDFEVIQDIADALVGGSSLEGEGDFKVDIHLVRVGLNIHF